MAFVRPWCLVGLLVLASGCSSWVPRDAEEASKAFNECDPHVDTGGPGHLASTERWLELRSVRAEPADAADGSATRSWVLSVSDVEPGGEATGPSREERVAIHDAYLEGIGWGRSVGGRVFLALASEGLEREMVAYVVIRLPDGFHFLLAGCLDRWLRDRFLDRYDRVVEDIAGRTNRKAILRLLGLSEYS